MPQSSSVIHLANVIKCYGDLAAVNDVSLRIDPGEVVGFVGPNGAGKTTTIGMLMGAIRPTQGKVHLFGHQLITPERAHKTHRRIGFIAGDMALPENLTGEQYLRFSARRFGSEPAVIEQLTKQLKPQLGPKIKHLSRGNKQKIALLAALQHQPDLIILDEPTSGLDPLMQQTFLQIVADQTERGATVLMSSHILSEVADACSRILFMKQGRIVSDKLIHEVTAEAGKLITIKAATAVRTELKRSLPPGAKLVKETEQCLIFSYNGPIKSVLRWLSIRNIEDVTIDNRELDDIFHDLYKENA